MVEQGITSAGIAELLNGLLAVDPQAVYFLMCSIAPANQATIDHPTVVVNNPTTHGPIIVSFLGFLQGIGAMDGHRIEAMYEDRKLVGFRAMKSTPGLPA